MPPFPKVVVDDSCKHLEWVSSDVSFLPHPSTPCNRCLQSNENVWLCLCCKVVLCGRFANRHMLLHSQETHHSLALDFRTLFVWCYKCESYLNPHTVPRIRPFYEAVFRLKYGHLLRNEDSSSSEISGADGRKVSMQSTGSRKQCRCGKVATLRVSESPKDNYVKKLLYYTCGDNSCDMFEWWCWQEPGTDINALQDKEVGKDSTTADSDELEQLKLQVTKLDRRMETVTELIKRMILGNSNVDHVGK